MLSIVVGEEGFDEASQEFVIVEPITLVLEHSLVSLSKWESIHQKPFLTGEQKTREEVFSYIECMILSPENSRGEILQKLSVENIQEIQKYIDSPQTATTFYDPPGRGGRPEQITAELIYYWMVAYTIPFECENWHLNRLFALVRICNIKNSQPEKPTRQQSHNAAVERARLNAERRKSLGTRG